MPGIKPELMRALLGEIDDIRALAKAALEHKTVIPEAKDGEPGKDAPSVDLEALAVAAAALIPTPDKGEPGKDAHQHSVTDIATIATTMMPRPKDGVSPDIKDVAKAARELMPSEAEIGAKIKAAIPAAKALGGRQGKPGKPGRPGKSITAVSLKDNELTVFIEGVAKKVGKIDVPVPTAPFNPGNGGGGSDTNAGAVAALVTRVEAIELWMTSQPNERWAAVDAAGGASAGQGLTIVRMALGVYGVTLDSPAPAADQYSAFIQIETGVTDTNAFVNAKTASGFTVSIGQGDNGGSPDTPMDRPFGVHILQ